MKSTSLEELEARCDLLQRRVMERSSPAKVTGQQPSSLRSPPRPAVPEAPQPQQRHTTSPVAPSHHTAPPPASNSVPRFAMDTSSSTRHAMESPRFSQSEISSAILSMEREKMRLEEQLRLVNMSLAAFKQLQYSPPPPPQQQVAHPATLRTNLPTPTPTPVSSARTPTTTSYGSAAMSPQRPRTPTASGAPLASPIPMASAAGAPSSSKSTNPAITSPNALQTEQIYEELRQIRRAREEREAARRQGTADHL